MCAPCRWEGMLREGHMLDQRFTIREATYIFVKVNIQDEVSGDEWES